MLIKFLPYGTKLIYRTQEINSLALKFGAKSKGNEVYIDTVLGHFPTEPCNVFNRQNVIAYITNITQLSNNKMIQTQQRGSRQGSLQSKGQKQQSQKQVKIR